MDRFDLDFENIFAFLGIIPDNEKSEQNTQEYDIEYFREIFKKELYELRANFIDRSMREHNNLLSQLGDLRVSVNNARDSLNRAIKLEKSKNQIDALRQQFEDAQEKRQANSSILNKKISDVQQLYDYEVEKVDKLIAKAQEQTDLYELLYPLVKLKIESKIKELAERRKPSNLRENPMDFKEINIETKKINLIASMFKTKEDLINYITVNLNVLNNIDVKHYDMSKYKYNPKPSILRRQKRLANQSKIIRLGPNLRREPARERIEVPDLKYHIEMLKKPEQIETSSEKIIYKYGTFEYATKLGRNGSMKRGLEQDLIGVIMPDETGKISVYHGVLYFANAPKEFYEDIVFSNIVLRNAMRNNFGFIGTIAKRNDEEIQNNYSNYTLIYNGIDDNELVRALSYATQHKGSSNLPVIETLSDAYNFIDHSLEHCLVEKGIINYKEDDLNRNTQDGVSQGDE